MPGTPPPRLAERMLALTIRDDEWRASILGDLAEEFSALSTRLPAASARRWYWRQALNIASHRLSQSITRPQPGGHPLPEQEEPRTGMLPMLLQDVRYAWRTVWHQPALSATVVLVLAVALAANATTFALIDALVLRPFRIAENRKLACIDTIYHEHHRSVWLLVELLCLWWKYTNFVEQMSNMLKLVGEGL